MHNTKGGDKLNMKDKILNNFNPKTALVTLAAIGLLGGGTAAVITAFATTTGTGTANAPVTGDTDVDFSYNTGSNSQFTAPATFNEELTLTNQNQNNSVDYTWEVTKSQTDGSLGSGDYINTGIFKQSTVEAEPEGETNAEANDVDITVTPAIDTISYKIQVPTDSNYDYTNGLVSLEVSEKNSDNYHVGYYESGNGWFYKDPSRNGNKVSFSDGDEDSVPVVEEVKATDTDNDGQVDNFTIVVPRDKGFSQTFGVNAYEQAQGGSPDNTNWRTENYTYKDTGTSNHTSVDVSNLVGQEVVLPAASSHTYNFVTEFTEQTGDGNYEVTAEAVP